MPSAAIPKKQWELSCKRLNKKFELSANPLPLHKPLSMEPVDPLADALTASFSHYIKVRIG
jgi:hypothetical protein